MSFATRPRVPVAVPPPVAVQAPAPPASGGLRFTELPSDCPMAFTSVGSPVGEITLVGAADGDAGEVVTGIYLSGLPSGGRGSYTGSMTEDPDALAAARRQLDEYFAGRRRDFDLTIALAGTEFQRRVWRELCAIPYGSTTSYGELAEAVGNPGASRAVGSANGRNRISIVVPCHRVIAADGGLGGYGGGLERKRDLLELEGGRWE